MVNSVKAERRVKSVGRKRRMFARQVYGAWLQARQTDKNIGEVAEETRHCAARPRRKRVVVREPHCDVPRCLKARWKNVSEREGRRYQKAEQMSGRRKVRGNGRRQATKAYNGTANR